MERFLPIIWGYAHVFVYLRTASFLGSRALAVCCIWPILFWRTQTRWLVLMMSFSSSWNKEQACRARSESCRKVRERTTLLMAHRSSKSRPSSLGIGCLHRSCGSTILLANGILHAKDDKGCKPSVKSRCLEVKGKRVKRTTSKYINPREARWGSGRLRVIPGRQSKVPRFSLRSSILLLVSGDHSHSRSHTHTHAHTCRTQLSPGQWCEDACCVCDHGLPPSSVKSARAKRKCRWKVSK